MSTSGQGIAVGPYDDVLETLRDGRLVRRSLSRDDDSLATRIAGVLRALLGRRPTPVSSISNALQGNLCEFCVWELGERHWDLYQRQATWPANAKSPWRNNSNPGIDILAVGSQDDLVLIIEVKSTQGGGAGSISGNENSLKEDFRRLFDGGGPDQRIWGSVQAAVTSLKISGNLELAERIVDAVGHRPEECIGVRLIGVLVCHKGHGARSQERRRLAFQELHDWLLGEGWGANQCQFRCVELVNFSDWLQRFVDEVTR